MTRVFLFIILSLTLSLPLLAQFEGEIDMKISAAGGETKRDQTLILLIKKGNIAITVMGEGGKARGKVIFREDKNVMWVVDDAKKSVMEIPTKEIEDSAGRATEGAEGAKVKFYKSGKSETILGYPCDGWIVEKEYETKEVYGTTKLGDIYESFLKSLKRVTGGRMESAMNEFESEMMKQKIFPLKSITMRDSVVTSTQEVTKIEPRSVKASTFEIPAGYKKQSMDAGMSEAMKKMQEEMLKYQKTGKMTPEMEKMIEEQMKQKNSGDSSSEHQK
jgi:hypothetical protein